jgi:hypothetical protein
VWYSVFYDTMSHLAQVQENLNWGQKKNSAFELTEQQSAHLQGSSAKVFLHLGKMWHSVVADTMSHLVEVLNCATKKTKKNSKMYLPKSDSAHFKGSWFKNFQHLCKMWHSVTTDTMSHLPQVLKCSTTNTKWNFKNVPLWIKLSNLFITENSSSTLHLDKVQEMGNHDQK